MSVVVVVAFPRPTDPVRLIASRDSERLTSPTRVTLRENSGQPMNNCPFDLSGLAGAESAYVRAPFAVTGLDLILPALCVTLTLAVFGSLMVLMPPYCEKRLVGRL